MKIIDDFITLIKHLVKKEENVMIAEINKNTEKNLEDDLNSYFEVKQEDDDDDKIIIMIIKKMTKK